MRIVDTNVLLYAINDESEHHDQARRWLDGALNGDEPVGFPWTASLGFLRLATHRAIFPEPLDVDEAVQTLRDWLAQPPVVVVEPTSRHMDMLAGLLADSGTAGNLVNDAHIAALAIEHGATVTTFDADFGRFSGVRWERPTGRVKGA
jgi:toxin-antitoxin system PIN domain toxin